MRIQVRTKSNPKTYHPKTDHRRNVHEENNATTAPSPLTIITAAGFQDSVQRSSFSEKGRIPTITAKRADVIEERHSFRRVLNIGSTTFSGL